MRVLLLALALFAANESMAVAQSNPNVPPFGTSTAGGSGGTPTGPTNPVTAGFGTNNVVTPHWPLNPYAGTSLHFKAGKAHGPHSTKNGCRLLVLWTERASKEAADLSDFTLATQRAA